MNTCDTAKISDIIKKYNYSPLFWIDNVGFHYDFTVSIINSIEERSNTAGNYKIFVGENNSKSINLACKKRGYGYIVDGEIILHPVPSPIKNNKAEYLLMVNVIKNEKSNI